MSRQGPLLLFAAALVLALVVGHLLRDTPGYTGRGPDGQIEGDIANGYVYWTRLVTLGGVQDAYHGRWPETYAVYPPVTLYAYQAAGTAYQLLEDPSFALERAQRSAWLLHALKGVALGWHVLTAVALFALLRSRHPWRAGLAAALYVANPAALFDVAHWGQPDGSHSLFSVLAVGWLGARRPVRSWVAIALAALAKPQAWAILPYLLLATVRQAGWRALAAGLAAGGVAGGVVLVPFLATGRLGEFLTLPSEISSVMPVASANAHNLWWLVVAVRGGEPVLVPDSARLIGPLTYRMAAVLLVGAQALLVGWLIWSRRAGVAEAAALGVLGWFVFTTQAHENHLIFALPLLALAWPTRPWLLVPFGALSVTVLLNMALHDQLLLEASGLSPYGWLLDRARGANATANLLTFLLWSGVTAWQGSAQPFGHLQVVSRMPTRGAGSPAAAQGRATSNANLLMGSKERPQIRDEPAEQQPHRIREGRPLDPGPELAGGVDSAQGLG